MRISATLISQRSADFSAFLLVPRRGILFSRQHLENKRFRLLKSAKSRALLRINQSSSKRIERRLKVRDASRRRQIRIALSGASDRQIRNGIARCKQAVALIGEFPKVSGHQACERWGALPDKKFLRSGDSTGVERLPRLPYQIETGDQPVKAKIDRRFRLCFGCFPKTWRQPQLLFAGTLNFNYR